LGRLELSCGVGWGSLGSRRRRGGSWGRGRRSIQFGRQVARCRLGEGLATGMVVGAVGVAFRQLEVLGSTGAVGASLAAGRAWSTAVSTVPFPLPTPFITVAVLGS